MPYRIIRHALLWVTAMFFIYAGFEYIARTIPDVSARQHYTILSTLFFGVLIIFSYIIITWVTQQFILLRFRFGSFTGSLFLIHVLISTIVRWHFLFFTDALTLARLPRIYALNADHIIRLSVWQVPFDSIIVGIFSFSLLYNNLLYAVGFKVFKDLFILKIKQEKLEKENLQLEFNFLKAQVSPHFLFNTLNNIYSFSITSPGKVPNTILKLADLMRYSLYETNDEFVPLSNELSFLASYVDLQRIRHEEDVRVTFSVEGRTDGQVISPLLLIVFVENAFKHGVQASAKASWVDIRLAIVDTTLTMHVDNSVPATRRAGMIGGIGISNVRKRLEYFYPSRYQLLIQPVPGQHEVALTIDLRA